MLHNVDDPNKIWRGFAVALICPLYGACVAEFFVAPCMRCLQIESVESETPLVEIVGLAKRGHAPLRQAIVVTGSSVALLWLLIYCFAIN